MAKPRMVIEIEGGIIQNIDADIDIDVLVLDFDTDGAHERELAHVQVQDYEGKLHSLSCIANMWNVDHIRNKNFTWIERAFAVQMPEED